MDSVVSTVTNTFWRSSSMFVHSRTFCLTSHPFWVLWLTSCDKCVVIRTQLMTHSSDINWVIWLIRKIQASHEDSLLVSLRVIRLIFNESWWLKWSFKCFVIRTNQWPINLSQGDSLFFFFVGEEATLQFSLLLSKTQYFPCVFISQENSPKRGEPSESHCQMNWSYQDSKHPILRYNHVYALLLISLQHIYFERIIWVWRDRKKSIKKRCMMWNLYLTRFDIRFLATFLDDSWAFLT